MKKENSKPIFITITEEIRKDILFGRMAPGKVLNEKEIASRFNTSRAPVRESLRTLEGEGLIVRNHPVGYKVRDLNLDEFIEKTTLLKIIEREMLARAIPRYTELDYSRMERVIQNLSAAETIEELIINLIRFTEVIHEPTGWKYSVKVVREIMYYTVPFFMKIAERFMEQGKPLIAHRIFIEKCRQGKMQEAIDAWIKRYDKSGEEVYAVFSKMNKQTEG